MKTTTEMTGKQHVPSFSTLMEMQAVFQIMVTNENVPIDSTAWFSYHIQAIMEELGEVLKADKRWKTHRNVHYDPENKLEELADVAITLMNLVLFSGFDYDMLCLAIEKKIDANFEKLGETMKSDSNS